MPTGRGLFAEYLKHESGARGLLTDFGREEVSEVAKQFKLNDALFPTDRRPIGDLSPTGRRPIADQFAFNGQLHVVPRLS